jgi:hypothetical protein
VIDVEEFPQLQDARDLLVTQGRGVLLSNGQGLGGREVLASAATVLSNFGERRIVVLDSKSQETSWIVTLVDSHRDGKLLCVSTPGMINKAWITGTDPARQIDTRVMDPKFEISPDDVVIANAAAVPKPNGIGYRRFQSIARACHNTIVYAHMTDLEKKSRVLLTVMPGEVHRARFSNAMSEEDQQLLVPYLKADMQIPLTYGELNRRIHSINKAFADETQRRLQRFGWRR